ncbi:uncharacterized protein LOC132554278 [Ylistrum balloti]|uniref:uncharacterized protein LOC132554278 n=1 Tax=Ylistrum balloti TaxID=509963 RepID=UPI0029058B07|nr:uncharacterized protein LOC132554278 [Ylistrum balloti]
MMVSGTKFSTDNLSRNSNTPLKGTGNTTLVKDISEERVNESRQEDLRERQGLLCDKMGVPIQISMEKLSGKSRRPQLQDIQNTWDKKTEKKMMPEVGRQSSDHDKEIEKLTRELREANNILHDIETNISAFKYEKDVSHQCLLAIKDNYRSLLEEKNTCQKQISFIKKELNSYRIRDRRLVREFDQLNLCYGKLDQRERLMRRQISLMEAELSLVVSKLEAPKTSNVKPVVPRLDLSKLKQPKKLPPVKNPSCSPRKIKELQQAYPVVPNAPRKLYEIIHIYDQKDLPNKMKRRMWPQHSSSSPLLGTNVAKTIPSARGTGGDCLVPLVGSHCQLSSRSDKETKPDLPEEPKILKLPLINEEYNDNQNASWGLESLNFRSLLHDKPD